MCILNCLNNVGISCNVLLNFSIVSVLNVKSGIVILGILNSRPFK